MHRLIKVFQIIGFEKRLNIDLLKEAQPCGLYNSSRKIQTVLQTVLQ